MSFKMKYMKTIDIDIQLPIIAIEKIVHPDIFRQRTVGFIGSTIIYIGQAPYGSNEEDAVWKVTKTVYDHSGLLITKEVAINEQWSKYSSLSGSIERVSDFLYKASYTSIDYGFAEEWFKEDNSIGGNMCTSFRKGNYFCRNLDWYYSNQVDFVVTNTGKYKSLSVCSMAQLTLNDMSLLGKEDMYRLLPFLAQDGINSEGVFCSSNVVPLDIEVATVIPTSTIEKTLCNRMLPRYIIDNFDSADSAIDYIRKHVSIYHSKDLLGKGYTTHLIVGDRSKTYVIEFIGDRLEVMQSDVMTNFNLYGVTLNSDGTVFTNADVPNHLPTVDNGITPLGSGLERFNMVKTSNNATKIGCRELLNSLLYSNTYKDVQPFWFSEYVIKDIITVDTPTDSSAFSIARGIARQKWDERERNNPEVWHTTHSVIYDLNDLSAEIVSQENTDSVFNFKL